MNDDIEKYLSKAAKPKIDPNKKGDIRHRVIQYSYEFDQTNRNRFFVKKILAGTAGIAAVILFAFLIMFDGGNSNNPITSSEFPHLHNPNHIHRSLIAESRSEDNTTFRQDIQKGRLGIIEIQDRSWNNFLVRNFTFQQTSTISWDVQSSYDMVIETSNETVKIKIWILDDNVYYSTFPIETIFHMESESGLYFINVLESIMSGISQD